MLGLNGDTAKSIFYEKATQTILNSQCTLNDILYIINVSMNVTQEKFLVNYNNLINY